MQSLTRFFTNSILLCCLAFSTIDATQCFTIMPDSPNMDALGYDHCNMNTNGELLVLSAIQPNAVVFGVGAHTGERN